MEIIKEFFINFINLANAMSIYILIGLVIAGFLKELLPSDFISKHLGKSNFLSVIKATILGIPMPVCSCSVIPLAKSLQKEGASRGAVQSFLISTPITGVDSILATYSFFGWFFTLYRVITSVIMAIVVGVLQNIISKGSKDEEKKPKFNIGLNPTLIQKPSSQNITFNNSCNSGCCSSQTEKKSFSLKRVFNYAFNTLFGDIAKSLLIGLFIGALFSTFLPKELINTLSSYLFLTYLIVIVIAMPLYVCATSSLPIGASLLASGVPIGAVFVFLSAGPATNSITMSVVKDMFGKKSLILYISTIAIFSIIFGYVLDSTLSDLNIQENFNVSEDYGVINYIASAIMFILMAYFILKKKS